MPLYRLQNRRLPGYNPVHAGFEYCRPGHDYGPTARSHFLLHYIASGRGSFTHGETTYTLGAGDCFIIRPSEVNYYRADDAEPWHYIWIGFTAGEVPHFLQTNDVLHIPFAAPLFLDIEDKFAAYNSPDRADGDREAYLCGAVTAVMARLILHFSRPAVSPTESRILIAKNRIDTAYASPLTVAGLAAECGFERNYFSRRFKEITGAAPQEYLVKRRLSAAAELMAQRGFTPLAAAAAVGYTDIYLFSNMFRRHFGLSPRAYIRKHKNRA